MEELSVIPPLSHLEEEEPPEHVGGVGALSTSRRCPRGSVTVLRFPSPLLLLRSTGSPKGCSALCVAWLAGEVWVNWVGKVRMAIKSKPTNQPTSRFVYREKKKKKKKNSFFFFGQKNIVKCVVNMFLQFLLSQ